jgi:shikimate kinase
MKISVDEFDQRLKDGNLALTIVGMSNVGKSYWSEHLASEKGFQHICCDDMIEAELGDVLTELGYKGIADMSKWLGQPYDERFAANQQTYLDLEKAGVEAIVGQLEQGAFKQNLVVDTTGSVVHIDPTVRNKLKDLSLVVYIETPPDEQQKMFEKYLAEPKPVVFGDVFQPEAGETGEQTLARCYPKLLAKRSALYAEMADITILRPDLEDLHQANDFLNCIRGII